jgi:membrane protease subunit HflK
MFYEAMEKVLPDSKVIITDGNTQQMLPLESFSSSVVSSATGESDGN